MAKENLSLLEHWIDPDAPDVPAHAVSLRGGQLGGGQRSKLSRQRLIWSAESWANKMHHF